MGFSSFRLLDNILAAFVQILKVNCIAILKMKNLVRLRPVTCYAYSLFIVLMPSS